MLPNGNLAVSTRRGDIYTVSNPLGKADDMKVKLFARGLHEPLGIHWSDGWLYATQRCEVTRIKDEDGDGRADVFETLTDGWGINGDYHEYAFGSQFDPEGNMWVVLCHHRFLQQQHPYRGWCAREQERRDDPHCQWHSQPRRHWSEPSRRCVLLGQPGPWNGSSSLKHLKAGSFQSHPASYKWWDLPLVKKHMGPNPPVVPNSKSRIPVERERVKEYVLPACVLPHAKLGNSTSGLPSPITKSLGRSKINCCR